MIFCIIKVWSMIKQKCMKKPAINCQQINKENHHQLKRSETRNFKSAKDDISFYITIGQHFHFSSTELLNWNPSTVKSIEHHSRKKSRIKKNWSTKYWITNVTLAHHLGAGGDLASNAFSDSTRIMWDSAVRCMSCWGGRATFARPTWWKRWSLASAFLHRFFTSCKRADKKINDYILIMKSKTCILIKNSRLTA